MPVTAQKPDTGRIVPKNWAHPPPVPKKGAKKPPSSIGRAEGKVPLWQKGGSGVQLMQLPGQFFGLPGFKRKNPAAGGHRLFRHALA